MVLDDLQQVVEAINAEVLNLRSSVARVAILTLSDYYKYVIFSIRGIADIFVSNRLLGKALDPSIAKTMGALLKKAGAEAR
jgi:hypothetical protein